MKSAKDFLTLDSYYKAIEGSDSALWVYDLGLNTCYLSSRYYTMLGYEPDEFEGTLENLFALLHPDDAQKSQQQFADLFSGKMDTYRNEVRLRSKSGEYCPILTQGMVERDETGTVTQFIGWNIDISSLKEAQKALDEERALNIAQSRLAQLGLLSGGIAHEVKNPLTTIMGRSELLQRRIKKGQSTSNEDILKDLESIQRAAKRIAEIIEGLRVMVEGGAGQNKERIFIAQVTEEVLSLCQSQLESQGIKWHIKLPKPGPCVEANFTLMSQVFLNLIKNAADALEQQTEKDIWIEVTEDNGKACFSIEDNGSGIKPEDQDKLMLPFFTTKPPGKGTGLGLSQKRSFIPRAETSTMKIFQGAPVLW
jgi:PAS domain S-box-containing protein